MLTELQLLNSKSGKSVILPIAKANGIGQTYVRKAEGLNPPKASIAYSSYARLPGGVFHSSRREVRNIVLTLAHVPNFSTGKTVESLRAELEAIAIPGQIIRVRTLSGGVYRYINGYVESSDSDLFSKDTQSVISILCVDPFFFGNSIELTGQTSTWLPITYNGTAPTGFLIDMVASADTTGTTLRNSVTSEKLSLSTDLTAGQRVEINTEIGKKNARRIYSDGSLAKRLLGDVTIENGWPTLVPGSNSILVSLSSTGSTYKLKYREYFEAGV